MEGETTSETYLAQVSKDAHESRSIGLRGCKRTTDTETQTPTHTYIPPTIHTHSPPHINTHTHIYILPTCTHTHTHRYAGPKA